MSSSYHVFLDQAELLLHSIFSTFYEYIYCLESQWHPACRPGGAGETSSTPWQARTQEAQPLKEEAVSFWGPARPHVCQAAWSTFLSPKTRVISNMSGCLTTVRRFFLLGRACLAKLFVPKSRVF